MFGYFFLTSYRPPLPHYLLLVAIVAALMLLAWKIPHKTGKKGSLDPWNPRRLALMGFLTALAFFLLFMAGPYVISQPLDLMILGTVFVFTILGFIKRYDWNERTLCHKFTLTTGAISFLIALTPIQELDKTRPDNTQGMAIVGILALLMLILLRRKLKSYASEVESKLMNSENITMAATIITNFLNFR